MLVGHLWIKTNTSAKVSNFIVRDKDLPLPWQLLLYTSYHNLSCLLDAVQFLSHVRLFDTPWTVGHQTSLSFTSSWSLCKFLSQILKIVMHEDIILESRYYLKDKLKKYYHKIFTIIVGAKNIFVIGFYCFIVLLDMGVILEVVKS